MRTLRTQRGYTLVELLVAAAMFVIVAGVAVSAYVNVFTANRKASASRQVVDEGSFVMERLVKEVRNGTIDYPEYVAWAQRSTADPEASAYLNAAFLDGTGASGDAKLFYDSYTSSPPDIFSPQAILGDEDTPIAYSAEDDPQSIPLQNPGLVLISPEGTNRIRVFRWVGPGDDGSASRGRLVLVRERLVVDPSDDDEWLWIDADADITDDTTWTPKRTELTSEKIDVSEFAFVLSPTKDPFFAFSDTTVQRHPSVRLHLGLRTSADELGIVGTRPSITLNTMISLRTYSTVPWSAQ